MTIDKKVFMIEKDNDHFHQKEFAKQLIILIFILHMLHLRGFFVLNRSSIECFTKFYIWYQRMVT